MIVRKIPAGDLALDDTGNFVFLQPGTRYTRQKLASRLKFFLGEWFLDRRKGVPYFRHVLVRNPDLNTVRHVLRRVILGTPGVLALDSNAGTDIDIDYDPSKRRCAVAFTARCETGAIVVSTNDPDFIIEL